MTAEQQADWRAIAAQFEPEWFDAGNAPLLVELVRHLSYSRQLSEALEGLRRRPLTSTTASGAKGRAAFAQLTRMHSAQTKTIAMLSVKLRLSNSAHRTNDPRRGRGDGRLLATVPSGPKPWEQ